MDGPARGPDGKFVSKQPAEASAQAEPQTPAPMPEAAQPAEPARAPDGYVPVSVVQELRKEIQALKQQPMQPPQPPAPMPDPFEDFDAYRDWQESQATAERAEWSRQLAEAKHGADTVQQAREWAAERFANDPIFAQQSMSSRDPYGFAIEAWKRDQVLTKLSDPGLIDRFLAFAGGQPQQAPAAAYAAPPQPPTPPRSLASAPSAGGDKPGAIPVYEGAAFDSVFKD